MIPTLLLFLTLLLLVILTAACMNQDVSSLEERIAGLEEQLEEIEAQLDELRGAIEAVPEDPCAEARISAAADGYVSPDEYIQLVRLGCAVYDR